MKFFYILTLLYFGSCDTQKTHSRTEDKLNKADSLKSRLLGKWGGLGEDSPVWEIKLDSIYYYQENKSYPYQIMENDLVIERGGSSGILSDISVVEDTLNFYDEQGLSIKAYRFKTKK